MTVTFSSTHYKAIGFYSLLIIMALILELSLVTIKMKALLIFVGIINLPVMAAIVLTHLSHGSLKNQDKFKIIKLLLRVVIVKSIGSILGAIYMCLKYVCMLNVKDSNKHIIRSWTICAVGIAFIGILCSIVALSWIKRIKDINKTLKQNPKLSKSTLTLASEKMNFSETSTVCSSENSFEQFP